MRYYALIAGGGTAGHALPALRLAEELGRRKSTMKIGLIGGRRGLERKVWSSAAFDTYYFPGRGIPRVAGRSSLASVIKYPLEMAYFGINLLAALLQSIKLMVVNRPYAVVVFGGYSAIAPALAGVSLRVPLVVVNVDAIAGRSNRVLSYFARAVAVAWPGTGLAREQVTGMPVSSGIIEAGIARRTIIGRPSEEDYLPIGEDRQGMMKNLEEAEKLRHSARDALGIPEGRTVVIAVGGSLGARRLNELVMEVSSMWTDRDDLAVYHIVGERFLQEAAGYAERLGLPCSAGSRAGSEDGGRIYYRQVGYEPSMDRAYLAADFVICRAGAVTVGELSVAAVPALLIPLPGAPSRHQEANAAILTSMGAAIMLEEKDITVARLGEVLKDIVDNRSRLEKMSAAYPDLDNGYGTSNLADLVERCTEKSDRHL